MELILYGPATVMSLPKSFLYHHFEKSQPMAAAENPSIFMKKKKCFSWVRRNEGISSPTSHEMSRPNLNDSYRLGIMNRAIYFLYDNRAQFIEKILLLSLSIGGNNTRIMTKSSYLAEMMKKYNDKKNNIHQMEV